MRPTSARGRFVRPSETDDPSRAKAGDREMSDMRLRHAARWLLWTENFSTARQLAWRALELAVAAPEEPDDAVQAERERWEAHTATLMESIAERDAEIARLKTEVAALGESVSGRGAAINALCENIKNDRQKLAEKDVERKEMLRVLSMLVRERQWFGERYQDGFSTVPPMAHAVSLADGILRRHGQMPSPPLPFVRQEPYMPMIAHAKIAEKDEEIVRLNAKPPDENELFALRRCEEYRKQLAERDALLAAAHVVVWLARKMLIVCENEWDEPDPALNPVDRIDDWKEQYIVLLKGHDAMMKPPGGTLIKAGGDARAGSPGGATEMNGPGATEASAAAHAESATTPVPPQGGASGSSSVRCGAPLCPHTPTQVAGGAMRCTSCGEIVVETQEPGATPRKGADPLPPSGVSGEAPGSSPVEKTARWQDVIRAAERKYGKPVGNRDERAAEETPVAVHDPAVPTGAVRESVQWFAEQMERKLQENDCKGGWGLAGNEYLLARLREETVELGKALVASSRAPVIREAADVANFAMMIADHMRPRAAAGSEGGLPPEGERGENAAGLGQASEGRTLPTVPEPSGVPGTRPHTPTQVAGGAMRCTSCGEIVAHARNDNIELTHGQEEHAEAGASKGKTEVQAVAVEAAGKAELKEEGPRPELSVDLSREAKGVLNNMIGVHGCSHLDLCGCCRYARKVLAALKEASRG